MDPEHGHGHGHGHGGASPTSPRPGWPGAQATFSIALALNLALVCAQFFYGFLAHSSALMADAAHNLSDVLGLALALAAALAGARPPSGPYTYGLRGAPILAALANGSLLLLASAAIAVEALGRLWNPSPVASGSVVALACIGIVVNGACALLLSRLDKSDVNARAAFAHMAADAGISASVAISAIAAAITGWTWIDPVLSLAIVVWIASSSWALTRQSLRLALAAAPDSIDVAAVEAHLGSLPGVLGVHDLHVWAIGSTETALTAHLVMADGRADAEFLPRAAKSLSQAFGIGHSTMQIESGSNPCSCPLMAVRPANAALAHHGHHHHH